MEKYKRETSKRLLRLAALPYNFNFRREVEELRGRYEIIVSEEYLDEYSLDWVALCLKNRPAEQLPPVYQVCISLDRAEQKRIITENDLSPSLRWYLAQIRSHKTSALPLSFSWPDDRTYSSWELTEKDSFSKMPRTDIPFERDVLALMTRYSIPLRFLSNIILYAHTALEKFLYDFTYSPRVIIEQIEKRGEVELKITVLGISPFSTKDDWIELWDTQVKSELEIRSHIIEKRVSTKFPTVESYREQIKRYSEWYQLVVVQQLSIGEALNKWESEHPNQDWDTDESTVAKAVKLFQEVITPVY